MVKMPGKIMLIPNDASEKLTVLSLPKLQLCPVDETSFVPTDFPTNFCFHPQKHLLKPRQMPEMMLYATTHTLVPKFIRSGRLDRLVVAQEPASQVV